MDQYWQYWQCKVSPISKSVGYLFVPCLKNEIKVPVSKSRASKIYVLCFFQHFFSSEPHLIVLTFTENGIWPFDRSGDKEAVWTLSKASCYNRSTLTHLFLWIYTILLDKLYKICHENIQIISYYYIKSIILCDRLSFLCWPIQLSDLFDAPGNLV